MEQKSNIPTRQVGNTTAYVSQFGLGCAPLGELFEALSEEQAQATLQAAWDVGVRTSLSTPSQPHYGPI
jgi:D-threo-aldose 1-dehydrogenase